jgi:hypothetical protein
LRQEAESIKHLPDFRYDSVLEEVHVHAGGGDNLAGRRGAEIFPFVGSGKHEAVCYPLAIGNGIAYIQTDIRKCTQDLRVVFAQARGSRTNAAGETVMDDGLAVEPQVSFKIADFIPGVGLAKGFKIFLARHLFLLVACAPRVWQEILDAGAMQANDESTPATKCDQVTSVPKTDNGAEWFGS